MQELSHRCPLCPTRLQQKPGLLENQQATLVRTNQEGEKGGKGRKRRGGGSTLATVDWQRLKAVFKKSEKAEAGMMAQSVK